MDLPALLSADFVQTTLSQPPFLSVEGAFNIRRLPLPPHSPAVVRAGELSRVTPAGAAQLRELGIARIFDLRSHFELARDPCPPAITSGIDVHHIPVVGDAAVAAKVLDTAIARHAGDGDTDLLDDYDELLRLGGNAFATVLTHWAQRPHEGFLFHCTAGKDRTGVLAALILLLAGTTDEVIAHDYALTRVGIAPVRERLLGKLGGPPASASAERMVGLSRLPAARAESMNAFLAHLREHYGGVEGYLLRSVGMSKDDVESLKERLRAHTQSDVVGRAR